MSSDTDKFKFKISPGYVCIKIINVSGRSHGGYASAKRPFGANMGIVEKVGEQDEWPIKINRLVKGSQVIVPSIGGQNYKVGDATYKIFHHADIQIYDIET